MTVDRLYNVLFLCTGNSARSILAETILNAQGRGRFQAYSACSQPKREVHPLTLETLKGISFPTEGLSSKSWDIFAGKGVSKMDFVFTVCDSAAGESCPVWPGRSMTPRWGVKDPAAVEGEACQEAQVFAAAARYLKNRVMALTSLLITSLDSMALQPQLRDIGTMEGSTSLKGKMP